MEDSADAFIMVPGGIGTFEEFFEILTLKQLKQLNKPIGVYNIDGYYLDLQNMVDSSIDKGFIKDGCKTLYTMFDDMDALIEFIESDKGTDLGLDELKRNI